jgi:hypothetical protein
MEYVSNEDCINIYTQIIYWNIIIHFLHTNSTITASVTITRTFLNTTWRHKLLKSRKSRIHSTQTATSRPYCEWPYRCSHLRSLQDSNVGTVDERKFRTYQDGFSDL